MKQMSWQPPHFDIHICTPGAGHLESEDCWCEPSKAYWLQNAIGLWYHVLEHNDTETAVEPWVNNVLDHVGKE